MSTTSVNSLKRSLLKLECHFTWTLLKQDVDLNHLEETTEDQVEFLTESNITNYNLLSYVCHLKDSNEEALINLQKAEAAAQINNPKQFDWRILVTWGNYAWIYYHMKRYEEAQTYISKVENSCKKLPSAAQGKILPPEIHAEQGWALLKFGEKYYDRAKVCFETALKAEPDNPRFNAGYAIVMYRQEDFSRRRCEDISPSLQPLKRAMELNPKNTFIMVLLGLKLQDSKKVDEGKKYIEEALQINPDLPYVQRYAAKFYRRNQELDKALEILKKGLAVIPKSSFLHHQMGLCYKGKLLQLKNATKYPPKDQVEELIRLAIFHIKIAIEQKTVFFSAHMDLANMYAEGKRYKEAEETFQKAFSINILSYDDKQSYYYNYGNFQRFHMRSESEAIRYYLEGLKIEKESYGRNRCAKSLIKLFEGRIQRGLGDATDFGTLGLVYNLIGEKHKAIECYEEALALCPDNEEYLSALCELRLSISN